MDRFTKFLQSGFALVMVVGLAGLAGCETNPYTGRSQLLMTSVDQEMQMGTQAYSQVKNDPKMHQSQDPREIEPVRRVVARIVEAAKRSKYAEVANQFQWEVTVFKDDKTPTPLRCLGERWRCIRASSPWPRLKQGWPPLWGMKWSTLWLDTAQNG
jgi:hypothetical protein